ncbi:MAG: hypothetical protein ACRAVC_03950 [Trichormus sp.]
MQDTLFTEVSAEQSAVVSGGFGFNPGVNDFRFNLDAYLFILGAGVVFGVPTLTAEETNFAFQQAISL